MSFQSLNQVVGTLQAQEQWQEQHQFRHLLQCWPQVVGPIVEAQTRPVAITRQKVLKVATSSSVWAQNLVFERQRILEKLNMKLLQPLAEIRFSTAQWQNSPLSNSGTTFEQLRRNHPSQLPAGYSTSMQPAVNTAKDQNVAFVRWASLVQARSRSLPLCPTCQCPTPPGELQRWSVCALCAVKQW